MSITEFGDAACAEVPLRDHVARFWKHLAAETVRIRLDLKRTVATEAPDGPVVYWDGAGFSDEVAKALLNERAASRAMLAALQDYIALVERVPKVGKIPKHELDENRASMRTAIRMATSQ